MDPKRQGEIALKVINYLIRMRGIKFSQNNLHEFRKIADEIKVPAEELKTFAELCMKEVFDECFPGRS